MSNKIIQYIKTMHLGAPWRSALNLNDFYNTEKLDETQLIIDIVTINIISSNWAGWIEKLNGPHMAHGSQFAHA